MKIYRTAPGSGLLTDKGEKMADHIKKTATAKNLDQGQIHVEDLSMPLRRQNTYNGNLQPEMAGQQDKQQNKQQQDQVQPAYPEKKVLSQKDEAFLLL